MKPSRPEKFWDILQDLVKGVQNKTLKHRYHVSDATLSRYRSNFLETVVRIKDNVVDDTQLKFGFMWDNWTHTDKEYFDPNKESTFFKKFRRQ